MGEVLICHWMPPVESVCWAITCPPGPERPPPAELVLAADMVRPCGSCTGDGDESGEEVMEVTWGIWISCLMCNCDVYMADWLLPLMLLELAGIELPPG